jgi:hypothetical protein
MSILLAATVFAAATPGSVQAQGSAEKIVAPAEVAAMVRAKGLRPLGPPVRQRSIYVLRAVTARGVQMRVVVAARGGKLLAVDPVAPGPYGGFVRRYGPPPYGYGYGPRGYRFGPYAAAVPPPYGRPYPPPYGAPPGAYDDGDRQTPSGPPLPRPRPGALAHQAGDDAATGATPSAPPPKPPAKPDDPPVNPLLLTH